MKFLVLCALDSLVVSTFHPAYLSPLNGCGQLQDEAVLSIEIYPTPPAAQYPSSSAHSISPAYLSLRLVPKEQHSITAKTQTSKK